MQVREDGGGAGTDLKAIREGDSVCWCGGGETTDVNIPISWVNAAAFTEIVNLREEIGLVCA